MASLATPLKIDNLVKKYGDFTAVDNVSFDIHKGEIFGLLGPNGAGKTTVISNIVTLNTPDSGSVEVFGHDVQKDSRNAKSLVGFVPQEVVSHGFFNLKEVLAFHSGFYGVKNNTERINYLVKKLGLEEHTDKVVRQLSGGMKRRLLIAKALVHSPKLLILDEPTAGVDVELREALWDFVMELKEEGMSILVTTHYLEEAEQLCDRVGIINNGKLLQIGPTKELIKKLTLRRVTLILNEEVSPIKNDFLITQNEKELQFEIPSKMGIGELLSSTNINLTNIMDLQIHEGSLEDAFKMVVQDA